MIPKQYIEVKWNSKNKSHYESLGYNYTHMGDSFLVSPLHSLYGKRHNTPQQLNEFLQMKRYAELAENELQDSQDKKPVS